MTYYTPATAFHPGEHLREEIETRKISQTQLANILGKPIKSVNEVINGKRSITPEFAYLLEGALEIPAEMWLNLQKIYDLDKVRHKTTKKYQDVEKRAKQYALPHPESQLTHA